MSRFGAEAPTDNAHKKHGNAVLFIFHNAAVRGPCFKELFAKSSLKIRKNFAPTAPIYLGEVFNISKNFFYSLKIRKIFVDMHLVFAA